MKQSPGTRPGPARTFLWLLAGLAAAACGSSAGPSLEPYEPSGTPDVIVVTLDTARADRFSYAGDSPVRTPAVDAIAAEGTAFLQAITPAPITLVAHSSLFSGQTPLTHGVRDNGTYSLGDATVTLAEVLAERGYRTGAFVGAAVLKARYGLDQGFEHYDDELGAADSAHAASRMFEYASRRGQAVVDSALSWLDKIGDDPALVWVHLWDPHAPYLPPEPERSEYAGRPYDGEIAYADRMVGRLVEGLRERERYDDAVVVVASDHGEGLGEHGELTHALLIYDTTLHVPLVVRAPSLRGGRRVEDLVGLIDVFPTVLGLLGLESPAGLDGRDLTPLMRGGRPDEDERALYVESRYPLLHYGWMPLQGLRRPRLKLIEGVEAELYDIEEDPGETEDLAGREPGLVEELSGQLADRLQVETPDIAERVPLDEDARAMLESLGYVWADDESADDASVDRPDPRRMIHLLSRLDTAAAWFAAGLFDLAIDELRDVLAVDERNVDAVRRLGKALMAMGRHHEAAEVRDPMLRRGLGRAADWTDQAHALRRTGREDEASAAYDTAVALMPDWDELRWNRWLFMLSGDQDDAVRHEVAGLAGSADADSAAVATLAVLDARSLPVERRAEALEMSLAASPSNPHLRLYLADLSVREGRLEDADRHYRTILRHHPGSTPAALGRAGLLVRRGEDGEARRLLEPVAQPLSTAAETFALLARTSSGPAAVAAIRRAVLMLRGDVEAAARLWSVGREPDAEVYRQIGTLLLRGGLHGEGARALALATSGPEPETAQLLALAEALESAGETRSALDAFSRAARRDPGSRAAASGRWRTLGKLGRWDVVRAEAEVALGRDSTNGAAHVALLHASGRTGTELRLAAEQRVAEHSASELNLLLAELLVSGSPGDRGRAGELYRQILMHEPEHPKATVGLGELLLVEGRTEEARRMLEAAVRADSGSGLLVTLGQARARTGDLPGAFAVLAEAATLAPENPEVWFMTGNVHLAAGTSRQAVECYEITLALGLDNPVVQENLRRARGAAGLAGSTTDLPAE